MINFGKRILIQGPEVEASVAAVVDYASRPGHEYYPTAEDGKADAEVRASADGANRPANREDRADHCIILGSYWCCYSITVMPEGKFKHLSIRTPDAPPDTAPQPVMCIEIGKMFKFDPDPRNWQLNLDECQPACCVILEPISFADEALRKRWNDNHPKQVTT